MPKVVFTHAVTDPAHWASKHAERVAAFASWGTNVVDYVSPDGGKTVAVGVDVHDMAAMQAALTSPEIAAAKQAHGVVDPITMLDREELTPVPGADEHLISRRRALALFGAGALAPLGACSGPAPAPVRACTQASAAGAVPVVPSAAAEALHYLSLQEIGRRIAARQISPVMVTERMLGRIGKFDSRLKSYATVMASQALADARAAEQEIAAGRYRGPLHGMPVAVKDLCYTKGVPTMGGTPVLRNFVPDVDGTVVAKLRTAGAVILGKLNLTEGAMAGYHPDMGIPVNPWDATKWPGASSSGSGVATAAGLCYAAIGTDTGGSIRFPSGANGLVGLKPTYGRVSRFGVLPLAESLDHVGPMARTVGDVAVMYDAIAGHDPQDVTSLSDAVSSARGRARWRREGTAHRHRPQVPPRRHRRGAGGVDRGGAESARRPRRAHRRGADAGPGGYGNGVVHAGQLRSRGGAQGELSLPRRRVRSLLPRSAANRLGLDRGAARGREEGSGANHCRVQPAAAVGGRARVPLRRRAGLADHARPADWSVCRLHGGVGQGVGAQPASSRRRWISPAHRPSACRPGSPPTACRSASSSPGDGCRSRCCAASRMPTSRRLPGTSSTRISRYFRSPCLADAERGCNVR